MLCSIWGGLWAICGLLDYNLHDGSEEISMKAQNRALSCVFFKVVRVPSPNLRRPTGPTALYSALYDPAPAEGRSPSARLSNAPGLDGVDSKFFAHSKVFVTKVRMLMTKVPALFLPALVERVMDHDPLHKCHRILRSRNFRCRKRGLGDCAIGEKSWLS